MARAFLLWVYPGLRELTPFLPKKTALAEIIQSMTTGEML
jgi:hypothetical protein